MTDFRDPENAVFQGAKVARLGKGKGSERNSPEKMPDKRKAATIEDVARLARVSRQTVSNVVNRSHPVRETTADRVHKAIRELDYKPNLGARRLRTNRSRTIGVRLERYAGGISGAVLDRFLHGLTEAATDKGYRIMVYAADDVDQEIALIRDLVSSQEIDAVVLTGTFRGDPRPGALAEAKIPHVAFGRPWCSSSDEEKWVDIDGAFGVALATRAAIAGADKPPAFLGWPSDGATGDDRKRGWELAMEEAGFSTDGLSLAAPDDLQESRKVVREALGKGLEKRAGSMVCASDLLAVATQIELANAGITGWSVTGFDNTPTTEILGISSVEQRPEYVAARVVAMLLDHALPPHLLVEPELVLRDFQSSSESAHHESIPGSLER